MQSLFPFGFPAPTATYLAFYVLTLAVHAVLMSYVLAGSGYAAVATILGKRERDPAARVLTDWLPFGLGTAITAGVAPLLFLQVLYKEPFYTANLLLFHRWMAIVPVLIAGFYLLYLAKTRAFPGWPRLLRAAVTAGAFACFAFTAWSWTDNHLVSLDRDAWPALYAAGPGVGASGEVLLRLGLWLSGAMPIMALIAGWQLRHARVRHARAGDPSSTGGADDDAQGGAVMRLALVALGGIFASTACGLLYTRQFLSADTRALLTGALAGPYLGAVALGLLVQTAAWLWHLRTRRWSRAGLAAATAGMLLAVIGTAVLREAVRLSRVDLARLLPLHERAAESGGMVWFLLFLVVNAGILVWAATITRRGLRAGVQQ